MLLHIFGGLHKMPELILVVVKNFGIATTSGNISTGNAIRIAIVFIHER